MNNNYRHGDINFHSTQGIEGEIVKHNGSFVVGLDETTGHKHVISVKNPSDLVVKRDSFGNMFFELKAEGKLSHEEHKTIKMKPGIYKRIQEREVDHFAGSTTRSVID